MAFDGVFSRGREYSFYTRTSALQVQGLWCRISHRLVDAASKGRGSWALGSAGLTKPAPPPRVTVASPRLRADSVLPWASAAVPWFSKTRSRGNPRPVDRRVGAHPALPHGSFPHLPGLPRGLGYEDVTATHPDPQGGPSLVQTHSQRLFSARK